MGLRRDEEQAIAGRGGEISWDERREVSFDCIDEWMLEMSSVVVQGRFVGDGRLYLDRRGQTDGRVIHI